jgi:alkylation response protein AidB-like acyl-CoA dehydrogenase
MSNFYKDNSDIRKTIEGLGLEEVAALLEEDFKFAGQYDYAPKTASEAVENYLRALEIAGEITGNRIASTAEHTDQVGNILNDDGSVTYTPGIQLALKLFSQSGLMGIQIPYYLGGLNMPCVVMTAVNDMVSRADASLMNMIGLQGIADTINMFADEDTKKQYVPKLVSGEYTGAMVLTEPDAGSDLQSVKTMAYQDENGNWFVNGVKRFITNGCGDVLLVLARTEPEFSDGRGLSCLLVEKCPQVKIRRLEHKLGINGSPTCEMVFDNAPARLIGMRKRGLITYVMALMNGARVGIAGQGTGIAEAAYRAAREYASERKQFGVTIDQLAPIKELLADMSIDVQASRALAYYCSKCVDMENGLTKKFETLKGSPEAADIRARMKKYAAFNKMLTPMAKYFASEMSMRVSSNAISVLGGSGYMKDYPVERYYRDARITTIYEGTSQLQVVAAIAGVMSKLVNDVIEDILGSGWQSEHPRMTLLLAKLEETIEFVKTKDKSFHDLSARKLVDAGIALINTALFVKLGKQKETIHYLLTRFPFAKAGLELVMSGCDSAITQFEELAPMTDAE